MTKVIVKAADGTGAVELFHDAAKKLETSSAGATVTGGLTVTTNVSLPDDGELKLGNADDLKLYHDGTNSYIKDNGTGSIITASDSWIYWKNAAADETIIKAGANAQVELYYDNSKKIETIATGVNVTGGIRLGGNNAANECDDYEEGTWTPSITASSSNPTIGSLNGTGYYTKVGNMVYVSVDVSWSSRSGGSGDFQLAGLPFACKGSSGYHSHFSIPYWYNAGDGGNGPRLGYTYQGWTLIKVVEGDANSNNYAITQVDSGSTNILMGGTYLA